MSLVRLSFLLLAPAVGVTLPAQTVSFGRPTSIFYGGASSTSDTCNGCLQTADFNSDGNIDIAFSGSVRLPFAVVLLGNGDGTFRHAFSFDQTNLGGSGSPALVIGDFNGDGKLDVVLSGAAANIYLGNGDGTFSGPSKVPGCSGYMVSAADLNRDGRLDLACGQAILLGHGDGTFIPGPQTLDGPARLIADFVT
jgi:hypothetical protein